MSFHWTCPYCDRDTTITDSCSTDSFDLTLKNSEGRRRFTSMLIVCPNPKCQRFTLEISMFSLIFNSRGPDKVGDHLQTWNLVPPSIAKVFPTYVPQPIRDDYLEACLIRDLSPKASSTLSRRCLQGMIRDFWGISKGHLIDEIEALKGQTDALTWKAIDAVRSIGNIGAHMEKDINVIVDVEAEEAQKLIGLIELLVKDWYIRRHEREQSLADIVQVKEAKDARKAQSKP